jgi:hypothetical protein
MLFAARSTYAADVGRAGLMVRGYTAGSIRSADWQAAVGEARAILGDAGIDVDWIECSGSNATQAERCAQPLRVNEVAVRLVRSKTPHDHIAPLGESLLDPSRQSGTLATIYLDRVEWLARSAGVRANTVLARAIAHELGHLLLGTTAHNREGLMRSTWTSAELRRGLPRDWRFTASDITGILAGLIRRTQQRRSSEDTDLQTEERSQRRRPETSS